MRIHFKQAVHLDGKDYALGTHDVPESVLKNNKYFHKLMEAGLVMDAEGKEIISPESLQERNRKLSEKLQAAPVSKVAPTPVVEQPAADEGEGASPAPASSSVGPESEEAGEDSHAKHEKHQHKKKHGK